MGGASYLRWVGCEILKAQQQKWQPCLSDAFKPQHYAGRRPPGTGECLQAGDSSKLAIVRTNNPEVRDFLHVTVRFWERQGKRLQELTCSYTERSSAVCESTYVKILRFRIGPICAAVVSSTANA
jgi:hypothetical protein